MVGTTNLLFNFIWASIICAYLSPFVASDMLILSLNQMGKFVEIIRAPFFEQILTKRPKAANESAEDEQWTELLIKEMNNLGAQTGTSRLIKKINGRIQNAEIREQIVSEMRMDQYERQQMQLDVGEDEWMVQEALGQLTVRELIRTAAEWIVDRQILSKLCSRNSTELSKLYTWWYRFRYSVDSGVTFTKPNDGIVNEIRVGMYQYYFVIYQTLTNLIEQFDHNHPGLSEALAILDRNWEANQIPIRIVATPDESKSFDPFNELREDYAFGLDVLMRKPIGEQEVPVYVFIEKFPVPYKLGTFFKAIGVTHRGVKVYGIEFHFGYGEGIIIGDKIRKRPDPEKGIKFKIVGWTKKSQWEVQNIFDKFNDFSMENGQFKEGKFSLTKYHLKENNCIAFSRAFVEALLEGTDALKSSKWPPNILKQPAVNGPSCDFVTNCFVPPTTVADPDE